MGRALNTNHITEPKSISDVIKGATDDHSYHREVVTLKSGFGVLAIGTVMAEIAKGTATSAAKTGGNTGNGTLTVDGTTPVRAGAKVGVYQVRLITAATNAGTFRVSDPDGYVLGDVAVGGTFDNDIKFATADGATDFIVGDGFDITVAAGSKKWAPYQVTGVDGTADPRGILITKADTTDADVAGAIVVTRGPLTVSAQGLVWHSSVDSTAKKDAALRRLADERLIVARAGA